MTNDGPLANLLAHPRYGVEKTYQRGGRRAGAGGVGAAAAGSRLAEGRAHAKRVSIKSQHKQTAVLELVLDEGKNREVRCLLAQVGHKVLRLKRTALGPLRLGDLAPGEFRPLKKEEVKALRDAAVSQGVRQAQPSGPARPASRKAAGQTAASCARRAVGKVIGGNSQGPKPSGSRPHQGTQAGPAAASTNPAGINPAARRSSFVIRHSTFPPMSHFHAAHYADGATFRTVEIVENVPLARDTWHVRFHLPEMAHRFVPGQFLMLRLAGWEDPLLGRPLALYDTVVDANGQAVGVNVVYLVLGKMTSRLAQLGAGAKLDVWGPLGNGFPADAAHGVEHLIFVAGGIGQTPFLALAQECLGRRVYGDPPRPAASARRITLCYGTARRVSGRRARFPPPRRRSPHQHRRRLRRASRLGDRSIARSALGWHWQAKSASASREPIYRLPHHLLRPRADDGSRGKNRRGPETSPVWPRWKLRWLAAWASASLAWPKSASPMEVGTTAARVSKGRSSTPLRLCGKRRDSSAADCISLQLVCLPVLPSMLASVAAGG